MADDVFSQIEGDVVQGHDQSPLAELVGEGKKFKSLEDLAVGKQEADKHIEQLEGELKLLREQMGSLEEQSNKAATVSDLVAAVRNANKPDVEGNQPVSEEQLQEMVASIMDGRTEAQTRASNYQEANQSVLDKFNGDVEAARTYTAERAKQLHMTAAQLKALGEESPSAFKQLMDVKPSTGSQSTQAVPGAVQTGSMAPRMDAIDGHHTKAYYDKLKAEIGPAKYWNDTKIQGQYMKDAVALGDRFNQ
jgi:hypothetical protein